jgi:hypothetical protein
VQEFPKHGSVRLASDLFTRAASIAQSDFIIAGFGERLAMIKLSPIGFILPFSAFSAPPPISNVRSRRAAQGMSIPPDLATGGGNPLNAGMALTAEADMPRDACAHTHNSS